MGLGHVGAAFAGALVTVLVYQFLVLPRIQARPARADDGTVAVARPPAPVAHAVEPLPAAANVAGRIAVKEQEIARLQEEVTALRADNAASQEHIAAIEGKPRAWPANLPAGYRPESMEARITAMLEKSGLGALTDLDCDEFPCVAVIESKQGGDDWNKKLRGALSELARDPDLGGRVSMAMSGSRREDGDKTTQANAVSFAPADLFDADLQKRISNRAQSSLEKSSRK
jgi:hypothetical protein